MTPNARHLAIALLAFSPLPGLAQEPQGSDTAAAAEAAPVAPTATIDKRVFGVIPNYRTADGSLPFTRLTARRKFYIGYKDSVDYPVYFTSAFYSGIAHLQNSNPSFGQGLKGYAHRLGTSYGDQAVSNLMTESIFPSLLHQDPRYFRRGTGTALSRTGYALSRILVARNDNGRWGFNYAEVLGNSSAAAISNLYYPEGRSAGASARKLSFLLGTDAAGGLLKEFWPDIKRKLFDRKHPAGGG